MLSACRRRSNPRRPRTIHGHRGRLRDRFRTAGPTRWPTMRCSSWCCSSAHAARRHEAAREGADREIRHRSPKSMHAPEARLAEVDGVGDEIITEIKLIAASASRIARGEVKQRPVLSSRRRGDRLLPRGDGVRGEGAIPHPVSRQEEPADRRRGAADRHRRSHAGLSARGGEARAGASATADHFGAQSPVRRSDAVERRRRR